MTGRLQNSNEECNKSQWTRAAKRWPSRGSKTSTRNWRTVDRLRDAADWAEKLRNASAELRASEEGRSRLMTEMLQSSKRASELGRLSHLKQELKERQKRLETLLSAHRDRISSLLGEDHEWDADTAENVHKEVLRDATSATAAAERKRDDLNQELKQLEFKNKTVRNDLIRKKAEAERCDQKIRDVIDDGPNGYGKALEDAEESINKARENSSGWNGLHDYFQQAMKIAEDTGKCRTCRRGFGNPEGLAKFRQILEESILKAQEGVEGFDSTQAEADYKQVLELAVVRDTWEKIVQVDIPAAEKDLAELDLQRQSLISKLENHDKTVAQRQQAKRDLESIGQMVASIGRCDSEVKTLDSQVEELSAKKSQQSAGRTSEEIQEELDTTVQNVEAAQSVCNRLRAEQEQSRASMSSLELELRDLKSDLSKVEYQLEKKASLVARVEEFRAMNEKQRKTLDNLTNDLEELDPQISTAQAQYDDVDQRAADQEREMSDELSKLGDSVNNLDILNSQIQSYVDRGGPDQLAQVNRDLKNLEKELDTLAS